MNLFGSEGEVLDPELHDAMMTQSDKKKDDNTILSVFEKGYRYHDKVIRHAKVVVNKKMRDFYDVLGVSKSASNDEIKKSI